MKVSEFITPLANGFQTVLRDVADGFFEITHNSMALLGAVVALGAGMLVFQPEIRHQGEVRLTEWLTARKVATIGMTPELSAVKRATAVNPSDLPREQANLALWISRKYRVAPEPVAALVAEAYRVGRENQLDPKLVLAIIAIESSFNPFAQSAVGAQGLMQVMTDIHSDKYAHFGGRYAAFDPKSNLRVGVKVLKDYVTRSGSVEGGLKWYVGAANLQNDGGYADKVLAEYSRMVVAAKGDSVPVPKVKPAATEVRADAEQRSLTLRDPKAQAILPVEVAQLN